MRYGVEGLGVATHWILVDSSPYKACFSLGGFVKSM